MQVDKVIRAMLDASDETAADVSRTLGRAPSWARTVAMPGRSPSLSTVAAVAGALGYRVAVLDSEGRTVCEVDAPGAEE